MEGGLTMALCGRALIPRATMGGETRNPQLRQDYRIISSMSQNCLKFWDKFETKLRTDLRPYRDNFETYLTIFLLRANWDIFETWVHSGYNPPLIVLKRIYVIFMAFDHHSHLFVKHGTQPLNIQFVNRNQNLHFFFFFFFFFFFLSCSMLLGPIRSDQWPRVLHCIQGCRFRVHLLLFRGLPA